MLIWTLRAFQTAQTDWLRQVTGKHAPMLRTILKTPKALNYLNNKGSGVGKKKQLSKELNPHLHIDSSSWGQGDSLRKHHQYL